MPAMTALFSRIIPILFVADLAAERDFYIRLGFHVTYEGPEYPDFASLGHGTVEFGIERRDGFRFGAPDHVLTWQLGVSDIDLARKRLTEAGVPFREELMAPAPLNIVCFRVKPAGKTDAELNALNQEILLRLQESGVAVPSHTMLDGRFAIRVAVSNHRSRREDFDLLVKTVVEIASALRVG